MKNSILKITPTVQLRDWTLADMELYRHWNTGRHKWMDFDGPYYDKLSLEELDNQIPRLEEYIKADKWPSLRSRQIIASLEDDKLLGQVSRYWQSRETNWLSIGIVIYDEADWGKGIGYEALGLWIDYLFEAMPELVRLDMRTWSGNHGMMKLGKKLGFKQEACFRKARIIKGVYYDSIGMGILREEWERGTAE